MTGLELVPTSRDVDAADGLLHLFCTVCGSERAWCGAVAGDDADTGPGVLGEHCIVCLHLQHQPCASCGGVAS